MSYRRTIAKRERFVDRLTMAEVAVFVGVHPVTIREHNLPYGSVNDRGHRIYTVKDACQVFESINGRLARASEVAILLREMGLDEDDPYLRAIVLKLWRVRVVANKEVYDRDL